MSDQQTMDGSPAYVERTLTQLYDTGKFAGLKYHESDRFNTKVLFIQFQAGPISHEVNGCAIEDVIDVLVTRLEGFQNGPFRCDENALAITQLEEAKRSLLNRTDKRQAQGVEGTSAAHES